ncbi:MAG: hypothetical protein K2Y23_03510 [Cyanobacteria bacterium]|nr:hypothetical protein [Cyanobacteriota bacterium]
MELQGRRRDRIARALIALLLIPAAAEAQADPGVSAAYEFAYDGFHYFFENPSTFDTPDLVPHNFKQTYWAGNHWLSVIVRYRVGGLATETSLAMTPSVETRGDDVDTFFLASGDVATSGTSGRVDMRSFRIRHDVTLGTVRGVTWHTGYQFRRDRQEFHARQIKTVTHSRPSSSESFPIDGAETTISNVHDAWIGVSREWRRDTGWRIRARVDAAPLTGARLTTILPFKYPGREIVFAAPVLTINPSVRMGREGRWPIALAVSATRTFSYSSARRFHHRVVSASITVGRSR